MKAVWYLIGLMLGTPPLAAQQPLSAVAEAARGALERGDLGALLRSGNRIQLQLPSAQPSGAIGVTQAEAVLRRLFGRGDEQRVVISRFRETGGGRGYVELRREYRPVAGGEARQQQVLLGYRRTARGWVVVEVRVY